VNFFHRIPPIFMWIAIAVSLFMNIINVNLISMVDNRQSHNIDVICHASHNTTQAVNEAHASIKDLIRKTRDNALARVGTPKELPTDADSVKYFTTFLTTIHTTTPLDCKGFK